MNNNKKTTRQYWFTVEGDTEKWYLEHFQRLVNNTEEKKHNIKINFKKCTSPASYAKTVNPLTAPKITHLCDMESTSEEHQSVFRNVLRELSQAKKQKGINYEIGYSNYTFELWIILHQQQLTAHLSDRFDYLSYINSSYSQNFETLNKYKERDNFQKVLNCIDINSIKFAIKNAERIEKLNEENLAMSKNEYGVKYYLDNPSLSIHKEIKQILKDCGIIPKGS